MKPSKKFYAKAGLVLFVGAFSMCHKAEVFPDNEYDDRLSGGAATVLDASSRAFSNVIDGLSDIEPGSFTPNTGDGTFDQTFVAPPSKIFTGLGPIFNNISCVNCHRNDAEGIPTAGFSNSGLLCRLSLPGADANGGPLPVPGFGGQLQDQAVIGAQPEATVNISYTDLPVTYPDGTIITLRNPSYTLQDPYTPLPGNYLLSPRLAPPLVGMGLLENIPESTILSFVDANDANGDGITGKANYVYDVYTHKTALGRSGLKANTPTILTQVATAYQQDMGVTSYVQPVESATGQPQMSVVHGDVQPELVDSLLNYVTYYVKTLAVPARRNVNDPVNIRGYRLFNQVNCSGCHRPTMQTGTDLSLPRRSAISAFTPIPICSSTIWARGWPITVPITWLAEGNGERPLFGASDYWRSTTGPLIFCMMAAPGRSKRRSYGMTAKPQSPNNNSCNWVQPIGQRC